MFLWHRCRGVISWWSGFTYCRVKHCKADVLTNVLRVVHSYLCKIAVKIQTGSAEKGAGLHKVYRAWNFFYITLIVFAGTKNVIYT